MPKVFLNGRELQGVRKGYTDVHYVFDHVTLGDGKNRLKAVVSRDGKEYTDEIEWNYSGEKNRGTEATRTRTSISACRVSVVLNCFHTNWNVVCCLPAVYCERRALYV